MGIAKTIAKNTTFEFITNFSELGIAFVIGIALTRGLGTEQYGLYAYTIWLLGLAQVGTNLGLGDMSRRFIPEAIGRKNTLEPAGFVQLSLMFRTTAALVVLLAILVSSGYWARVSGNSDNQLLFMIAALTMLPSTILQALVAIFKGFQKFNYSLYLSLTTSPLRLVLVVIFMALGYGVLTVIILNIVTLTLGVLIGFFLLRRLVPLRSLFSFSLLSSDRKKQALRYSLIVAGMMVLGYLLSQETEIFFIGLYRSVEDVGFFKLAITICSLISVFPTAFAFVILPIIAEQFGKGDTEKMKKIYLTSVRCLMMVVFPIATGGIALASSIIILLYGTAYSPAIILLQVVSLPSAIYSITGASDAVIRGINRPGFLLITNVFLSIINVGLSLWLIPKYGMFGATLAISVRLVLALPFYIAFTYKGIGAIWPVLDTLKIAAASLIMGAAVYALQSHLGVILGLALCIPLGVVIYIIAIFALRVIQREDINIFRGFQDSLPSAMRKSYATLMNMAGRFVGRKRVVADGDSYRNP